MADIGDGEPPRTGADGLSPEEQQLQDDFANADTTIQIEGTIDSVYVSDKVDVVVVTEDGHEQTVEPGEDKSTAIEDEEGNQYMVSDG